MLIIHDIEHLDDYDYEIVVEFEGEFALVEITADEVEWERALWGDREVGDAYVCAVNYLVDRCHLLDENGEKVMPCCLDWSHDLEMHRAIQDKLIEDATKRAEDEAEDAAVDRYESMMEDRMGGCW